MSNKRLTWLAGMSIAVMLAVPVALESLNIASLLNIDEIFRYANMLLAALIPVVLLGLGFALAKFIVVYVQRVFNNLS